MLGVMKMLSKGKVEDIFAEIIAVEGILVPLAAVNFGPMGSREEIGLIRKEQEGAV